MLMRKLILIIPVLIVLLSLLAAILFVCQQWVYGCISLIACLSLNVWTETFPIHLISDSQKKKESSFRLLTYNVNRAHSISKNESTTHELIDFITQQDADIILLQEYNHQLYPEVRESLSAAYPYGLKSEGSNDRFKTVFSRYPVENYEQLWVWADDSRYELFQHAWYCKAKDCGKEILPVCSMVVNVSGQQLRIVNCHLMSNNYSVVIRNTLNKGRSLVHAILPILARLDYGYDVRKLQAEIIAKHLKNTHEDGVIVCGDFNDISGSSTLRTLQKMGLKDAWWHKGCGFGFTFHGMKLRLRLDHVLFSGRSLRLDNVFIPHSKCSDHDPIVCNFKLR